MFPRDPEITGKIVHRNDWTVGDSTDKEVVRLRYTTTIDECVDAHDRMIRHLPVFRKQRTRHLWWTGASFAAAMTVVMVASADVSFGLWIFAVVAFACTFGWGFTLGYGRLYYDAHVRRQARAALSEMFGTAEPIEFQVELREETAWTSQRGIELAFPWRLAIEVRDASDAVELWFDGGLVLIRNRAFNSVDHRAQFVARAEALVVAKQPA